MEQIEDTAIVIQAIATTPPDRYRLECDTSDRQQHWHDCRYMYAQLGSALNAVFLGKPTDLSGVPADRQNLFLLWVRRWVALYLLIQMGWDAIVAECDREKLPLPATPGKTLVTLLEDESDSIFLQAFPEAVGGNFYRSFSPRQHYRHYQESRKIQKLLSRSRDRPLTQPEQRRIKKFQRAIAADAGWHQFQIRTDFYVQRCCQPAARKQPAIRDSLGDFQRADAAFSSALIASIHPSKPAAGYAWNWGILQHSAPGGVYR